MARALPVAHVAERHRSRTRLAAVVVVSLVLTSCTGSAEVAEDEAAEAPSAGMAEAEAGPVETDPIVEGDVEVVWSEGFTLHVPAEMTWQVTGLDSMEATSRSGAVIAREDDLAVVIVWQPAVGSPDDMLQRALGSLVARGVRAEASEVVALDVGERWSASARSVTLASSDGDREGFAAAWRCDEAATSFAVVAYDGTDDDHRHAVRLVIDRFACP